MRATDRIGLVKLATALRVLTLSAFIEDKKHLAVSVSSEGKLNRIRALYTCNIIGVIILQV